MRRAGPSRTCRGRDASLRGASIGQRLARDAKAWSESTDYPDADSCPRRMSRTHARTGGRRANGAARLPLCRSASRFKLAWQSSAFLEADGRSAYHRTQTVAAACNPLGATTIVLHSRKEGTFVRPSQRACFRCGSFPLIPTPVSASRTLPCVCRARRRRDPGSPTSLAWRCCEPEHACVCRERSAAAKSHSMKRKNRRRPRTDPWSPRSPCSSSRCSV